MKAELNAPVTVKDVQAYGILLVPHLGNGLGMSLLQGPFSLTLPLGSGRD